MTIPASPLGLSVTYIPADCGSIIPGKSKAPNAFRSAGLVRKLRDAGLTTQETYALSAPAQYSVANFSIGSVRNETLNIDVCESVNKVLADNLLTGGISFSPFQLVIGGECCQLPAVLSAVAKSSEKRVGLVYIDADLDLTSPTDPDSKGYFAGMNTTHLLRLPGSLDRMAQFSRPDGSPLCDAANMVFFGTNMDNPGNRREHFSYLFDHGFKVITSQSVTGQPEDAARQALLHLQDKVDVIFVHLDVDAIDPQMFPLANVPNFTGVHFDSMMRALGVFLGCEEVRGIMIAEANPDHDPDLTLVTQLTDSLVELLAGNE